MGDADKETKAKNSTRVWQTERLRSSSTSNIHASEKRVKWVKNRRCVETVGAELRQHDACDASREGEGDEANQGNRRRCKGRK